jgi:hypothetical protein
VPRAADRDDLSQFITLCAATHHLMFGAPPAFIETFTV